MIAETSVQSSFGELANYLSYGREANNTRVEDRSKRVDWEAGRNVSGPLGGHFDGGEVTITEAAREMATTASKKSVKTPVYHLILSWKSVEEGEKVPPDDPTREEMEEAVDRVLETLGLEEHQAWMVAHKDTSTPHVHVMINRVHPETSRTWNPPFPKKETYPVLRELEAEKGWHQAAPEDPSQTWESPESLEGWEATQEEKGREEASVRRWAREASVP